MRLIDADTVQMKLYEECQNIRHFDKDREKKQIFADGIDFAWVMLDNAPTVKAIPVEYIEAFKREVRNVANGKAVIDWLLEELPLVIDEIVRIWEKENETN